MGVIIVNQIIVTKRKDKLLILFRVKEIEEYYYEYRERSTGKGVTMNIGREITINRGRGVIMNIVRQERRGRTACVALPRHDVVRTAASAVYPLLHAISHAAVFSLPPVMTLFITKIEVKDPNSIAKLTFTHILHNTTDTHLTKCRREKYKSQKI